MPDKNFRSKFKNMPVPLLPTAVGAATLSNIWSPLGFTWIRHITMWVGAVILIAYLFKVALHFETVKNEYLSTVPASLVAGFTMFTMIFGSYMFAYNPGLGKGLWYIGLSLHAIHIVLFTYFHVIKNFNYDTFVPSWLVTYAGIMVATVVGGAMGAEDIAVTIVYYGFLPVFILVPILVVRLIRKPIHIGPLFMTKAILIAPPSLFLVSYLNVMDTPTPVIVYLTYAMIAATLFFILWNLPKFFSFEFHPGFAGLTFPLAIACLATNKMAAFVGEQGYETFGNALTQIGGIQLYITTAIIGYVIFKFFALFLNSFKQKA